MKFWYIQALLLILPFVSSESSLYVETYTKEYGEPCNELDKCNFRHWLRCTNGLCECLQPDRMLYTPPKSNISSFFASRSALTEIRSCRARVHEGCIREFFWDDDDSMIRAQPLTITQEGSSRKQTQLCVQNAYCHPHGVCKCERDYTINPSNGTCEKFKGFSESCRNDSDCHPDRFLKCQRGVCQCEGSANYSSLLRRCTVGPGRGCNLAVDSLRYRLIDNCVQNASCHLLECKCNRGFTPDYTSETCVLDYQYSCDPEKNPCATITGRPSQLVCMESKCVCSETMRPIFYSGKFQGCVDLGIGSGQRIAHWSFVQLFLTIMATFLTV